MNPVDYYNNLTVGEKRSYAERAGTTLNYLRAHIFRADGKLTRTTSLQMVIRLTEASKGNVSLDEAVDYFLVQPVKKLAAESSGATHSISDSADSFVGQSGEVG